jgi:hypothetical protein
MDIHPILFIKTTTNQENPAMAGQLFFSLKSRIYPFQVSSKGSRTTHGRWTVKITITLFATLC